MMALGDALAVALMKRKQFRKEVLSSGFGLACAIEILEDVVRGELAFDRTLKVNQQDPETGKADLSDRLPGNIETMRRMYDAAKLDFEIDESVANAMEGLVDLLQDKYLNAGTCHEWDIMSTSGSV